MSSTSPEKTIYIIHGTAIPDCFEKVWALGISTWAVQWIKNLGHFNIRPSLLESLKSSPNNSLSNPNDSLVYCFICISIFESFSI